MLIWGYINNNNNEMPLMVVGWLGRLVVVVLPSHFMSNPTSVKFTFLLGCDNTSLITSYQPHDNCNGYYHASYTRSLLGFQHHNPLRTFTNTSSTPFFLLNFNFTNLSTHTSEQDCVLWNERLRYFNTCPYLNFLLSFHM